MQTDKKEIKTGKKPLEQYLVNGTTCRRIKDTMFGKKIILLIC